MGLGDGGGAALADWSPGRSPGGSPGGPPGGAAGGPPGGQSEVAGASGVVTGMGEGWVVVFSKSEERPRSTKLQLTEGDVEARALWDEI